VDSSRAPNDARSVEDEVIVSVKAIGISVVGKRYCRPSGAREYFFGSHTRGLRRGLHASAPPGLRCAERIGFGIITAAEDLPPNTAGCTRTRARSVTRGFMEPLDEHLADDEILRTRR